ncbi:MAG: hypothetical protein ACPGWR_06175, partial [Ardenticatenaceae bacterium]
ATRSIAYDSNRELCFAFDFNRKPGTATVIQEQPGFTGVINEVYIPDNSNTPMVCDVLLKRFGTHGGFVTCFGDATGAAGGTAMGYTLQVCVFTVFCHTFSVTK